VAERSCVVGKLHCGGGACSCPVAAAVTDNVDVKRGDESVVVMCVV